MDRLFFEGGIEHVDVVQVGGKMTRGLPVQLRDGTAAFIAGFHSVAGNDQVSRNSVEAVIRTLTPKEAPARGKREDFRERKPDGRFQPDRVTRTENLSTAGIRAALK